MTIAAEPTAPTKPCNFVLPYEMDEAKLTDKPVLRPRRTARYHFPFAFPTPSQGDDIHDSAMCANTNRNKTDELPTSYRSPIRTTGRTMCNVLEKVSGLTNFQPPLRTRSNSFPDAGDNHNGSFRTDDNCCHSDSSIIYTPCDMNDWDRSSNICPMTLNNLGSPANANNKSKKSQNDDSRNIINKNDLIVTNAPRLPSSPDLSNDRDQIRPPPPCFSPFWLNNTNGHVSVRIFSDRQPLPTVLPPRQLLLPPVVGPATSALNESFSECDDYINNHDEENDGRVLFRSPTRRFSGSHLGSNLLPPPMPMISSPDVQLRKHEIGEERSHSTEQQIPHLPVRRNRSLPSFDFGICDHH